MDKFQFLIKQIKVFFNTTHWFLPINWQEQKDLFLTGKIANPQFIYPPIPKEELIVLLEKLAKIQIEATSDLENYYYKRQKLEMVKKIKMFLTFDIPEFTQAVLAFYPCAFDDQSLEKANKASLIKDNYDQEMVNSSQMSKLIQNYLDQNYQITNWQIETLDRGDFHIKLKPQDQLILIAKNLQWPKNGLDSMLAHEIDGHLVRAINMHKQKEILATQFPLYLKTEEGLASFLDGFCSQNCQIGLKEQAVKYKAGKLALEADFRTIFDFMISHGFFQELAYKRAFRLKRGFADTSKPGLFSRETMYFEGMLEVKDYIDQGGNITKLFAGKFGLVDLDILPEFTDIIVPKRLEKYHKNQFYIW